MARIRRSSAEHARRAELERALRRLAAGAAAGEVLDAMSRRLANKLLHGATVTLRDQEAGEGPHG